MPVMIPYQPQKAPVIPVTLGERRKNLHRIRIREMGRQRSSLLVGGRHAAQYSHQRQDDLKKRMNRIMDTWWNGCFGKTDDHLVHTTPNHHPPKMDFLSKTVFQIILADKWLVRHSTMSPNHERRPLPSLLSYILWLLAFYTTIHKSISCMSKHVTRHWKRHVIKFVILRNVLCMQKLAGKPWRTTHVRPAGCLC